MFIYIHRPPPLHNIICMPSIYNNVWMCGGDGGGGDGGGDGGGGDAAGGGER